jgi:hypothetical protein
MFRSRMTIALLSVAAAVALAACTGNPAAPDAAPAEVLAAPAGDTESVLTASGRGDGPVIYVTSQELFYDSIVTADPLPFRGKFQKLEPAGPSGLQTEWGPGDKDYRGGRWWLDLSGDGKMDETDKFFSCPLLGPGRETP